MPFGWGARQVRAGRTNRRRRDMTYANPRLNAGRMPHRAMRMLALAALAVLTAACTSAGSTGGSSSGGYSKYLIIDISGPLSDPFFGAFKLGSDAAAKELGIKYEYSAAANENNIEADYSRLIQAATGRKPDALVVGDYIPSAFDPLIKAAVAAGIPVVITNSGGSSWRAVGAITFIGEDPTQMGQAAGSQEVSAGVRHGLCVDHVPGNPVLEQRCAGYAAQIRAAGGDEIFLSIPPADANNPQAVQQAIKGALSAHPEIDGIFTEGPAIAVDAVAAVKSAGKAGQIKIGTTDLSNQDLADVKSRDLLFVLDQQPFLQCYYGLQIAAQYLKYRLAPGAPIVTGPFLITQSNVSTILDINRTYNGVRGAS